MDDTIGGEWDLGLVGLGFDPRLTRAQLLWTEGRTVLRPSHHPFLLGYEYVADFAVGDAAVVII